VSADQYDVLVEDLRRFGARMLAEVLPITAAEILGSRQPIPGEPLLRGAGVRAGVRARQHDRRDVGAGSGSNRGRRASVLIVAAAVVSLMAGGLVFTNRRDPQPDIGVVGQQVGSTEPTAVAPTPTDPASTVQLDHSLDDLGWPPRLLLDDSWEIVTADEPSVNEGSVMFRRGDSIISVIWYRDDNIGDTNAIAGATEAGTATLLGQRVTVYESAPAYSADDISALVEQGEIESEVVRDEFAPDASAADVETSLADGSLVGGPILDAELSDEVAAGLIEGVPSNGPFTILQRDATSISVSVMPNGAHSYDVEAFAALLPSIGHVDQAAWEQALPDRVVTPAQRRAVVEEMLADIPRPDGNSFPVTGDDTLVRDRVELAAEIQQQVACAWLNVYFQADTGSAAVAEALEAIATIPDWGITNEIAEAWDHPVDGVIGPANTGLGSLTVNDDGTITYAGTGEILDGYFAAQLCDRNAVG
jgi:hypothetical protein